MELTRVLLNPQRRGCKKLLGSPEAMHAAMLASFPPTVDPGRVLWRLDGAYSLRPTLYMVSAVVPDCAHLEEQAGWPTQTTTSTRKYDALLERLDEGQQWGFRLTANPTHRVKLPNGRSQVMGHITAEQQLRWLMAREEQLGLALRTEDGSPTVRIIERGVRKFRRGPSTVTLAVATFDGIARVTDSSALRVALTQGIGRGKAYGCGLLTLARP